MKLLENNMNVRLFAIFATILMLGTLAVPVIANKGVVNGVDFPTDDLQIQHYRKRHKVCRG